MPVVEPGTPQELKDWVNLSFKLSQAAGLYVGYICTVAHADGGGSVQCKPNQFPAINSKQRVELETAKIDLEKVLLPPRSWRQELKMPDRYAATIAVARQLGINRIIPPTRRRRASRRSASSSPAWAGHICGMCSATSVSTGISPYCKWG